MEFLGSAESTDIYGLPLSSHSFSPHVWHSEISNYLHRLFTNSVLCSCSSAVFLSGFGSSSCCGISSIQLGECSLQVCRTKEKIEIMYFTRLIFDCKLASQLCFIYINNVAIVTLTVIQFITLAACIIYEYSSTVESLGYSNSLLVSSKL